MVLSDSDAEGKPLIITDSSIDIKKIPLKITLSIWPIVGCKENYLAWQEKPGKIKRG